MNAIGSYIVARLGEASTYGGVALLVNAIANHAGLPTILQAVLGLITVFLPASLTQNAAIATNAANIAKSA
jgi:uncharacterized membrane protein